jgi:hypothetical protein
MNVNSSLSSDTPAHATIARALAACDVPGPGRELAAYDAGGEGRVIFAQDAPGGSVLVVDRRGCDLADARLVARIDPDEPRKNAQIICDHYLQHPRACRALVADDLKPPARSASASDLANVDIDTRLEGRNGGRFRLRICPGEPAEIRWVRDRGKPSPVSVRAVVGSIEDYEPARTLSLAAIDRHRRTPGITITTLGTELRRLGGSRIVLNRLLRETVLDAIRSHGLSMSAIALRCGRVKRDGRGNVSGETSWLARRIGVLPAAGDAAPTPWIHSDVLALIARRGLGIDPREVELG